MTSPDLLEFFCAAAPGLESTVLDEVKSLRVECEPVPGGIACLGTWRDVWRANLWLRRTSRVLVRIAQFRAVHLAQLDRKAKSVPWDNFVGSSVPIRVEATTRRSRIYHSGAASERIAKAIAAHAPVDDDASLRVVARIDDDLCTISVDTSGEPLYRRGYKLAVGKAPLREHLASAFLALCDFTVGESLVDPMCGSGTLVIEAAQAAAGIAPGRDRSFAFEQLPSFDPVAWRELRNERSPDHSETPHFGFDRDTGAVRISAENAERAGVRDFAQFRRQPISDLKPPTSTPGLVLFNPPYGARIGDRRKLADLYATAGRVLRERFSGWRVGLLCTDRKLVHTTQLPITRTSSPVPHGGLRIQLYSTKPLP
ncbi:MAG: class I SAM-dependent RNA methyltransferase [Myxococcota bacterium]